MAHTLSPSVWKALADPSRRKILDLLRNSPRTTQEICSHFDTSRYAVMKHIGVLEKAGLVLYQRDGRERWNYLNAIPIQEIHERWVSRYTGPWATSMVALKAKLEAAKGELMSKLGTLKIEQETSIIAPVPEVYDALTKDIAAWWGAPYQLTSRPTSLILEPEVGGRFYEKSENGGALWGIVQSIQENDHLAIAGRFGMSGAVQGVVTYVLEPFESGTLIKLTHSAIGEVTAENQASYEYGWYDLLEIRLRAYAENGVQYGLGHPPPEESCQ